MTLFISVCVGPRHGITSWHVAEKAVRLGRK
jgi:hypothetical protein